MNGPGTASLEERVASLERGYRRMRLTAIACGAIAVVCVLTAQTSNGPTVIGNPRGARTEISASGVQVYDADGKKRTFLGTFPTGNAGLELYDKAEKTRTGLIAGGDLAGLAMYGAQGSRRVYLGIYTNGSSGVAFYDPDGTPNWSSPDE